MNRGDCSHAWIAIDDGNIKEPQTITYEFPEEVQIVIEDYSAGNFSSKGSYTKYEMIMLTSIHYLRLRSNTISISQNEKRSKAYFYSSRASFCGMKREKM